MLFFKFSAAVSATYMLVSHSSRALVHVRRMTTNTYLEQQSIPTFYMTFLTTQSVQQYLICVALFNFRNKIGKDIAKHTIELVESALGFSDRQPKKLLGMFRC
jgi:hypothetical protein